MARRKKELTDADIKKMKDIEAYTHNDKKRTNNPPAAMAQYDKVAEEMATYSYDPHIDPQLDWAGKKEGLSFEVPTSSIHIHESIKPHKIIRSVQRIGEDYHDDQINMGEFVEDQRFIGLFETPVERMRRKRDAIEFYQHGVDWTNRMIAGDSLVIMNSLIEKEGMAGQIQTVYIDPPYGIKYGSNFQPFVDKRNVKDKKDEDLSQEPEMIKAFRDTWELGIHSYLSYLRDRLLLTRELLSDTGSVFVQISDENLHHVRELCDEVFGVDNYVAIIPFRKKTMPLGASFLESMHDFIVWYSKDKTKAKYHQLYDKQDVQGDMHWGWIELPDGTRRKMSKEENENHAILPRGARIFRLVPLWPVSFSASTVFELEYEGKKYLPPKGQCWVTNQIGMQRLIDAGRIMPEGEGNLRYIYYLDDFPLKKVTRLWDDTVGARNQAYVVQTSEKVIARCLLMTTDPGDLVLDPTCGGGTTAYVAERWGRRWITCDTSRVAIALAKKRLMTATFEYFKLAHEEQGVGSGFVYETVPRIALKTIANDEPAELHELVDNPQIDNAKVRITGPFTVEALPSPVVRPLEDVEEITGPTDTTSKQDDWRQQLLATGIVARGGERIRFSRIEPMQGTQYLQAEGETKEDNPRRVVICFGSETKPMDSRMVDMALDEVENIRPKPEMLVFAAFQFDPEAGKDLDEMTWPGMTILKAQMNPDLMTADLRKNSSSDQSFWLIGQPDVELIKDGRSKNRYKVKVNGFDYYDVKKGTVESGNSSRIAMWMLDIDYDGMCIEPHQLFFPMDGKSGGWNKLAKTLKAEIDPDLIQYYAGNESMWFKVEPNTKIAVKIIDDRGIESLRILKVGDE